MSRSNRLIGLFFILILLSATIWFSIKAAIEIYHYYQFKFQIEARVTSWSIEEKKGDRFSLMGHYIYDYGYRIYQGAGQAGSDYPNSWAAQEARHRFSKREWSVWIDPTHPERTLMERRFPIKKTLSASVMLVLSIYFFFLIAYLYPSNMKKLGLG